MKFKLATAAAAVVLSATASQAADLAKKAPAAVDYVKVCDTYGAGFFYIPGSDTCIKIGGYIRVQAIAGDGDFGGLYGDDYANSFTTRSRFLLSVDAISMTDYGKLRGYGAVYTEINSGNASNGTVTGAANGTYLDKAYIQWGGLTAGYAASFFEFFYGYENHFKYGRENHDDAVTLLAYTFGLGNGVSATLSLEDSTYVGRGAQSYYYGGNKSPDLVGNINVSQAWGSAQVMAALHQNQGYSSYYDAGWGYAVGAGVQINLPMLGAGDKIGIQAVYSDGATKYASTASLLAADFGYDTYGETDSAWSVMAGLKHNWSPAWETNFDIAYFQQDLYYDYKEWTAGLNLVWKPATNLSVTLAGEYKKQTYDYGSYDYNYDAWAVMGRIQRNF